MGNYKDLVKKYNADTLAFSYQDISGVADNVDGKQMPINGLRHNETDRTTGWYIWAGDILSQKDDFFIPTHTSHLVEKLPQIEKYLYLAPGWRFLIDTVSGHEDVWFDETLIDV
jgi:hypothetical protein